MVARVDTELWLAADLPNPLHAARQLVAIESAGAGQEHEVSATQPRAELAKVACGQAVAVAERHPRVQADEVEISTHTPVLEAIVEDHEVQR